MRRPPRPADEPIINREMVIGVIVQAVAMPIGGLSAFLLAGAYIGAGRPGHPLPPKWQTVAFRTLVLSELVRAFTTRSERYSVFKIGVFSDKWMIYAVAFSFILLMAVVYVPSLQTVPIG